MILARSAEAIEGAKLVYLGIAFAVAWIGIAAYLFSVTRRQRALEERLEKLKAEKDKSA